MHTWFKHTVQIGQKNQTSLGCFETLAKASSPARVQRDKNLWLCLCGAFSLELSTPTLGVSPGKGRGVPAAPRDKRISSDLLWIFCFYKYVQINYRHFEMSLVGINQHCKVMDSQSVKTQAGFSRQWFRSFSGEGEGGIFMLLTKQPGKRKNKERENISLKANS